MTLAAYSPAKVPNAPQASAAVGFRSEYLSRLQWAVIYAGNCLLQQTDSLEEREKELQCEHKNFKRISTAIIRKNCGHKTWLQVGTSERLVLFPLIHDDFKPLNGTSNIHLIQTVPHPCVWSHGPRVRGHCQTAVCLHFPILLRPQAGVVHRHVLKSGCTLS